MKMDKKTYNFVDGELRDYKSNIKKLEALELDIIEERGTSDGQPRGNQTSNPTEAKTSKLMTTRRLLVLHEHIDAIKSVYERLSDEYKDFFNVNYTPPYKEKKAHMIKVCSEVAISEREYYRRRDRIVYAVAAELGLI